MNKQHEESKNAILKEGEEVRLGIRPSHFISSQQPQHQHHYGSNQGHRDFELSPRVEHTPVVRVEASHSAPKINLHPSPMSRVSPQKPLKKHRKIRQSIAAVRSHRHWHNAKLVVGTVLIFLLIFNSQWFISQFMYIFSSKSATKTSDSQSTQNQQNNNQQSPAPQNQAEAVGPDNEIIIPKIGIKAPLVFINTSSEKEVLVALRDGVVHYYGTAYPGENGNTAFFGHSSNDWWEVGNYKFVFVLLEKLTVGDTYEIHYNSKKYVYKVNSTKVVEPNDLSVLNQTSFPTSTLITCTPPGTSWKRFVVSADQIAPTPNQQVPVSQTTTKIAPTESKLPSAPKSFFDQISEWFKGLFGDSSQKPVTEPTTFSAPQHLPEIN